MKNYNKLWIVPEENLVVLTIENKNVSTGMKKCKKFCFF